MIVRDWRETEPQSSYETQGVALRWVIGKQEGAPRFAMRVVEVQPGCATAHHQHWWEHEVYVLAGEGTVKGEKGEMPLRAGSVVYVPGDELHQFVNTGQETLQFICVVPHT